MDISTELSDGRCGRIDFLSASFFEFHHILCKFDQTPQHPVFGHLLMPETPISQPIPCVVTCHGSRGWMEHHQTQMDNWLSAGFAVFRIHSFEAREVGSIVEDQMMVTYAMMISDAFQALKILSTHPLIDSNRIAISGWSLGGTVALYSAWLPIAEVLAPTGERFAAHLPFYPAAHLRPEEMRWSEAPILVLHGDIDDYTPLVLVTNFAEELVEKGVNINVEIFPGGHHAFDSKEPLTWLDKAIRLDERTVKIDLAGDMSGEIEPGEHILLNEPFQRLAAFQRVQNIGAHVGGQVEARTKSQIYSVGFFNDTIGNSNLTQ